MPLDEWLSGLPRGARSFVEQRLASRSAQWYAVTVPADGSAPRVDMFESAEALARYMHRLDGTEVHVFTFYGMAVPYSRAPRRVLQLPGGGWLPLDSNAPTPQSFVPQSDWFLGEWFGAGEEELEEDELEEDGDGY